MTRLLNEPQIYSEKEDPRACSEGKRQANRAAGENEDSLDHSDIDMLPIRAAAEGVPPPKTSERTSAGYDSAPPGLCHDTTK